MVSTQYEKLSLERKHLQDIGEAPDWLSTAGFQLLKGKHYLDKNESPKKMYDRIAAKAASLTKLAIPKPYGYSDWYSAFFDIMYKGWLSPSTPVLTNMGNSRGHPISCSGGTLQDSIRSFYETRMELAQLTQRGYGTSVSLDAVRPRGSAVSTGGTANGVMQVASGIVQDMHDISQGTRRGSCGMYLNPLHPDFDEVIDQLMANDDGWNIGWNIGDDFEELFLTNPSRADTIWKKMLRLKMIKGKGYFFFIDKVNRANPQMYKDKNFTVKASNLCSEITLMADKDHSFTCVLSSLNIAKYDEWKDTKTIEISMVFLDAVIEDMLIKARREVGFERVIAFTEKSRAVGLGVLGLSTYYQQQSWPFGSFESIQFNNMLFRELDKRTLAVSKYLATTIGEPEWLVGYGERFSHRLALPPTMSTSTIQGGISLGIEPVFANVYEQDTAGGSVYRINPTLLDLMKSRNTYSVETMRRIAEDQGSVQGEDWLTEHEKLVFRTAFETNQETILLMASHRQRYVDQGQSLNLYFTADAKEEEVSRLHNLAYIDPYIKALYYVRSLNGVAKHKVDTSECLSCHG